MSIKQPPIWIIDWIDACNHPGWHGPDDLDRKPIRCQTVGFIVSQTKISITIASNRSVDEGYKPFGNMVTIPLGCIKKKRIVR